MDSVDRLKKLLDSDGFQEAWENKIQKGKSYRKAYQELENEYQKLAKQCGLDDLLDDCRYSSYRSFRTTKNRRIQRNSNA